jgi:hypothetical protein
MPAASLDRFRPRSDGQELLKKDAKSRAFFSTKKEKKETGNVSSSVEFSCKNLSNRERQSLYMFF